MPLLKAKEVFFAYILSLLIVFALRKAFSKF